MAGFTSPSILFLSTWDAPERSFCKTVFEACRRNGYTRFVEPCCGAFAMPLVAHNAGWNGPQMEASDTSLFSSIVGYMLDPTKDFQDLGVKVDGEPVELPDTDRAGVAAYLLWLQLLIRTECRPDVEYWRNLVEDLKDRETAHQHHLRTKLQGFEERLGGLQYRALDLFSHMEEVADDPHTVISINPPSYEAGFERFFDTKGRLTWNEPPYEVFDPDTGTGKFLDFMEGRAALILAQQQRVPGESDHHTPVFARHLSLGQNVYLNSNRPDEIFEITGGPKVATKKSTDVSPLDLPLLPVDHDVTPDSTIQVVAVGAPAADYYRGLWMHRLNAVPGMLNVLIVVDGYAAGIIGYNMNSMLTPFPGRLKWAAHLTLRFAFGAPHNTLRMTRLATMVALRKETARRLGGPASALLIAASEGLVTVEFTKHPEAKGLRGLMKLATRVKLPAGRGFKLVYAAPWDEQSDDEHAVLVTFLKKEAAWRKATSG